MKSSLAALLLSAFLIAPAVVGCAHQGDSIVVTGEGRRLSSEAIDADPLALLPSQPIAVATLDAKALFASPFGTQLAALFAKNFPLGQEAGFVPERDLTRIVAGAYSFSGVDGVAVLSGEFSPERIAEAAGRHAMTPLGVPLVRSRYAGNDVYTAGNVGLTLLTPRTLLVGSETAMRRAMDRIRDNRLRREIPEWIVNLLETEQATLVAAGDLDSNAPASTIARELAFLDGVKSFRVLGNFQPPGVNLAGALTYPDPAAAGRGGNLLQSVGQVSGLMNMFSFLGFGSPVRKLESRVVENDLQFVAAIDGQSFARLLAQAPTTFRLR